jgi:hypothetical protein
MNNGETGCFAFDASGAAAPTTPRFGLCPCLPNKEVIY